VRREEERKQESLRATVIFKTYWSLARLRYDEIFATRRWIGIFQVYHRSRPRGLRQD
jgi:hypothetical protein